MKFFSMLIKSYSISPVLLQRIMEKALFLQFFFFFFGGGGVLFITNLVTISLEEV